ncbi:hypothetical protein ACE4Z6_27005, partial [Salmonella enterica]|uniref:hypothetical protein n=1 Tax=Salmonella enterica TaxID=28901 RepID=UPI003D271C77
MEEFYAQLGQRSTLFQETKEKICSPLRDGEGELPRDSYPLPLSISDYLRREQEQIVADPSQLLNSP